MIKFMKKLECVNDMSVISNKSFYDQYFAMLLEILQLYEYISYILHCNQIVRF